MAVGKGSMERAAKAAEKKTEVKAAEKKSEAAAKAVAPATTKAAEKAAPVKNAVAHAAQGKAGKGTSANEKSSKGKDGKHKAVPFTSEVIAAPDEAVLQQIIYQKSNGMLERDAKPNESFGVGDDMPVYYF